MNCLICGNEHCACKGTVGNTLAVPAGEGGTNMAESTYENEVYIDVNGAVCSKEDKNLLRKISRQEAVRRGLIAAHEAPAPITDPTLVIHADGSTERVVAGVGTAQASLANPEEVRVTDPAKESKRVQGKAVEEDAETETEEEEDEKSVKQSEIEDKAVHRSAKK